jgi:hypothetical protein
MTLMRYGNLWGEEGGVDVPKPVLKTAAVWSGRGREELCLAAQLLQVIYSQT